MSWISGLLSVASTAVGVYSAYSAAQQAEETADYNAQATLESAAANAEISRYDASIAEMEAFNAEWRTGVELSIHMDTVERLIGNQKARLGKSGVALGKGSAQQVLNETAAAGAKDAEMIIHNGMTAKENALSAAKRYRMLADAGLRDAAAHATLITEAAADQSTGYYIQAAAAATQGLYQAGSDFGWWS